MKYLLEEYNLDLSEADRQRLLAKLPEDKTQLYESIDNLSELNTVSTLEKMGEKLDSNSYNSQYSSFLTDLLNMYYRAQKLDIAINSEANLNKALFNQVKAQIKEITNEFYKYQQVLDLNLNYDTIYRENFDNKNGFYRGDFEEVYYDPKNDTISSSEEECSLKGNSLILKSTNQINPNITNIRKLSQSGAGLVSDQQNSYPVDLTKGRSWYEIIETDQPFDIRLDEPLYNGKSEGAFCKIQLIFDNAQPINSITLEPIHQMPIDIINITAYNNLKIMHDVNNGPINSYQDLDSHPDCHIILGDTGQLKTRKLEESTELTFSTVDNVRAIEIAIRQPYYTLDFFNYHQETLEKISITERFYEKIRLLLDIRQNNNLNSVLELDKYNRNLLWQTYDSLYERLLNFFNTGEKSLLDRLIAFLDNAIPGFDNDNFKKLSLNYPGHQKKEKQLIKYKYEYGLKRLTAGYMEYSDKSMYISKLFESKDEIRDVSILTDEEIPIINDKSIGTIEYYISNKSEPREEEWKRILPLNYDISEIQKDILYSLRNNDTDHIILDLPFGCYVNSILVKGEEGIINISQHLDIDGNPVSLNNSGTPVWSVVLNRKFESSRENFIVEYQLHDRLEPQTVNLSLTSEPVWTIEKFEGTGQDNKVTLNQRPYVDLKQTRKYFVDPDIINSHTDIFNADFLFKNPNSYKYNPNYHLENKGYRPLKIDIKDQYNVYNSVDQSFTDEQYTAENDSFGLDYHYKFLDMTGLYYNQNRDKYYPYTYNITDYRQQGIPSFISYDPLEFPVIEYFQEGKDIYFNKTVDGEITVRYSYLTQGIRVKIILRNISEYENDLTPFVNNYLIFARSSR